METILKEILYEVKGNSKRLDALEKDMAELKEDVAELKEDVAGLKEDVAGLKEDVAVLKEDIVGLKEDVNGPRGRLARVEIDVKANRQMLTGMELRLAERIDAIHNKTIVNTQETRQLKSRLDAKDKIDEKWANETLRYIEVG